MRLQRMLSQTWPVEMTRVGGEFGRVTKSVAMAKPCD